MHRRPAPALDGEFAEPILLQFPGDRQPQTESSLFSFNNNYAGGGLDARKAWFLSFRAKSGDPCRKSV